MSGVKKVFKKVQKVVSKFDIGHKIVKQAGLPDPFGDILYGENRTLSPTEAAAKMQQKQFNAQMKAEQDALNQQALFDQQAKLMSQNAAGPLDSNQMADTTKVDIGGAAESSDTIVADMRRRKRGQNTSTQLGII